MIFENGFQIFETICDLHIFTELHLLRLTNYLQFLPSSQLVHCYTQTQACRKCEGKGFEPPIMKRTTMLNHKHKLHCIVLYCSLYASYTYCSLLFQGKKPPDHQLLPMGLNKDFYLITKGSFFLGHTLHNQLKILLQSVGLTNANLPLCNASHRFKNKFGQVPPIMMKNLLGALHLWFGKLFLPFVSKNQFI